MKKLILFIIAAVLLLSAAACSYAEESAATEEMRLKSRTDSYNRVVEIEGHTYVYYAQNSPEYEKIWVSNNFAANVGESTCSNHALANAIVNSIAYESLPKIQAMAINPIRIDTRNILMNRGIKEEESFEIKENADFFRYLSLAIINIAGGNNRRHFNRVSSSWYYKNALETVGLRYEQTYDIEECAKAAEENGALTICCTAGKGSPIANKFGHYMLLVYATEDKVYFLDSFVRDKYKLDKYGYMHIEEPGVVWAYRSDLPKLSFTGTKFIVYPAEDKTVYTEDMYAELIRESNLIMKKN